MFLFGAFVVTGFWTYWYLANEPYKKLQQAILVEYPETFPQVIGGRVESRGAAGPTTLRIVVRTLNFDPQMDEPRAEAMADRLTKLARDRIDLSDYREVEIVLFHKYQEQRAAYWQRKLVLKKPAP